MCGGRETHSLSQTKEIAHQSMRCVLFYNVLYNLTRNAIRANIKSRKSERHLLSSKSKKVRDEGDMPEASEKGIEGEIRIGLFIVVRSHSLQARVGTSYSVFVAIFRCSFFVLLHTLLPFFVGSHSLLVMEGNCSGRGLQRLLE
jgi:hypothetical protein